MSEIGITRARALSAEEISRFHEDGAAVLRGVLDSSWITRMQTAVDRSLAAPGEAAIEYTPKDKQGRYLGDFFMWIRDAEFRALMMDSPLPEVAAQIMSANEVHFLYDQLLVKEPMTEEETPWHQDLPYWPVRGYDVMSCWVPFDPVTIESGAVHYIKGSHQWGRMFRPQPFSSQSTTNTTYASSDFESMPDIAPTLDDYELLAWKMEPGDILIHHSLTVHWAPGNLTEGRRRGLALRYTGDDASYDSRPGTFVWFPTMTSIKEQITLGDGAPMGGPVFPKVWPR